MSSRHQSYFYNLRRFHNWVKRKIIDKYARGVNNLLDLASGKGGDLQKWIDSGIKNVYGFDIHEPSIIEARRRLATTNQNNINVSFQVQDLSTNVLPPTYLADVVTSMFAFHYFFKTTESLDTVLQSIENNLNIGGYFICCMFDGNLVNNKLGDSTVYDTPYFRLSAKQRNNDAFGNTLGVLMRETVLDEEADEYIVNPMDFIQLMKWRGFLLLDSMLFKDLFSEWSSLHPKNNLNNMEKEVSFLNRYYVFVRVSDLDENLECIHQHAS